MDMDKLEKEWLQEWKSKNNGYTNRLRKRLVKENPFTSQKGIEKILDRILLDPPADGPIKDENGIDLVYYEDNKNWLDRDLVYEMIIDDSEQGTSNKRYSHLYEKLNKTLSRLKNGKIIKMYFGLGGHKPLSCFEIGKKIKKSGAFVYWLIKKTMINLKESLQKKV